MEVLVKRVETPIVPTITTHTRRGIEDVTSSGWFWIAYWTCMASAVVALLLDVLVWRP